MAQHGESIATILESLGGGASVRIFFFFFFLNCKKIQKNNFSFFSFFFFFFQASEWLQALAPHFAKAFFPQYEMFVFSLLSEFLDRGHPQYIQPTLLMIDTF